MKQFLKSSVSTFALLGMLSNFAPSSAMILNEEESAELRTILTPLKPREKKTFFENKAIDQKEQTGQSPFSSIPDELIQHIFSFLDAGTTKTSAQVCSKFAYLILEKGCDFNTDGELTSFIPHPVNIFSLLHNMVSETPPELAFLDPQDPDSKKKVVAIKQKNKIIESKLTALANDSTSVHFLARLFTHLNPVMDFQAVGIASKLVKSVPTLQNFLKKAMVASTFPVDRFSEFFDKTTGLPQSAPKNESVERVTLPPDLQKVRENLMVTKLLKNADDTDAKERLKIFLKHHYSFINRISSTLLHKEIEYDDYRFLLEQLLWTTYTDDRYNISYILKSMQSAYPCIDKYKDKLPAFENFGKYYLGTYPELYQAEKNRYFYILLQMYIPYHGNQNYKQKRLGAFDAAFDAIINMKKEKTDVDTLILLTDHYFREGRVEKRSVLLDSVLAKLTDKQVADNFQRLLNCFHFVKDEKKELRTLDRARNGTDPTNVPMFLKLLQAYLNKGQIEKCSQIVGFLERSLTDEQIADEYFTFITVYDRQNKEDKIFEILNRAYAGFLRRAYDGLLKSSYKDSIKALMGITDISHSLFEKGYYEKAKEINENLLKLIAKTPANIAVKLNIAKCMLALADKNDFPMIEEYIQTALQKLKNKQKLRLPLDTITPDRAIKHGEFLSNSWLRKGEALGLKAALEISQEKFEEAYQDLLILDEEGYESSSDSENSRNSEDSNDSGDSEDSNDSENSEDTINSHDSTAEDIIRMFDTGLMKAFETQIDNPKLPPKLTDLIRKKTKEIIEAKEEFIKKDYTYKYREFLNFEKFTTTYKNIIDRLLKDNFEESMELEPSGKAEI